jgi:hypothetical protein
MDPVDLIIPGSAIQTGLSFTLVVFRYPQESKA